MKVLARLGFIFIGLQAVLGSIRGISLFFVRANIEADPVGPVSGLISLTALVAFGVLPGAYVLLRSRELAERFVPSDTQELPSDSHQLPLVFVAVLGVFLMVEGAGGLFSSSSLFLLFLGADLTLDPFLSRLWGSFASGSLAALVKLVAGCFLALRAEAVVAFLGLPSSTRAA